MKKLVLLLIATSPLGAYAGDVDCDMSSVPGIVDCLQKRTDVAEKLLKANFAELKGLVLLRGQAQADALAASQRAWEQLRQAACKFAVSDTEGQEKGITSMGCRLAETLKRVREIEALIDAEKTGSNKSFHDVVDGLVEIRQVSVSAGKIANPIGTAIINREFAAAQQALMGSAEVKANRMRIKSLRLINEGDESACKDASVYLGELGYYAHKTAKYVKIYVLSKLNSNRSVRSVRATVQEDLGDIPECP